VRGLENVFQGVEKNIDIDKPKLFFYTVLINVNISDN